MSLLGIDPADFAAGMDAVGNRPATLVHHQLRSHPLLTLDALADLADRLPIADVEHHRSDLPDLLVDGRTAQLRGVSPGELVRGVETNECWVVLWNIEQRPEYEALLDACLAEIIPMATPGERVVLREGFVFISAPNSVTPLHIDPEHNVLLQVAGEKAVTVGRFGDDAVRHHESERIVLGGLRWLTKPVADERTYALSPGLGVYVPPFGPHRVRNGAGPCVSLSVTWRTAAHYRNERVYQWNAKLRRAGADPRPPGESAVRDTAKATAWRAAHAGARGVRGASRWYRARSS